MGIKNKVILVTGSSDGIGRQTAIDLAAMGARVIVHGRDPKRTRNAVEKVISASGSQAVEPVTGDLSSFGAIHEMSAELHRRHSRIDVLVNNAGVYMNQRQISKGGMELTFMVNHLSYYLLTGLLLDLVRQSPYARIVNVASQAHASGLDFDNLQGEKYYEGYDAYARSKLCNILFTYRLAGMLESGHVTANVLHPGVISTKLLHEGWGSGGAGAREGSKTSVYLAASEEVEGVSGQYFSNRRMVRSSAISYDREVQDRLWQESERLTGFKYAP